MWKMRAIHGLALAGSVLLFTTGCDYNGTWPWAVGAAVGVSLLSLLGYNLPNV